jgi:hypothetical protein
MRENKSTVPVSLCSSADLPRRVQHGFELSDLTAERRLGGSGASPPLGRSVRIPQRHEVAEVSQSPPIGAIY